MSYTCLPWPTTGTTLHSVRIMQKCAQNVQKCAKKSFFGQILAKKRIFDAPKNFFLLFSFQKWIPLEKLDIKHVLYDFLHAISIIFKGVKKNVSIALREGLKKKHVFYPHFVDKRFTPPPYPHRQILS